MRKTEYFPFALGLNLVAPSLTLKPGELIGVQNYELENNGLGYRRILGYERFDGHLKPSEANYWIVPFDGGTTEVKSGDTVTGATSSYRGDALIDGVLENGSYADGDATGYLVLVVNEEDTGNVIDIIDNENLQVGSTPYCVANGASKINGAGTDVLHTAYQQLAISKLRSRISAVPGSGPIQGIVQFHDNIYAFRDDPNKVTLNVYKSSFSGWSKVNLGKSLSFKTGTHEIQPGNTVTGATSSASGTVTRVSLDSGSWTVGDAVGTLYFATITGTFAKAENLKVSTTVCAVADSASGDVELLGGGRFEFVVANFYGGLSATAVYGCDGVNPAFEFDGSGVYFAASTLDLSSNWAAPKHLGVYLERLFLGYGNGSLLYSAAGEPLNFSGTLGAGEIGVADKVAGISPTRSALIVFTRNQTFQLAGTSTDDWVFSPISTNTGALDWTIQSLSSPKFFDDRGLSSLNATAAFGNFDYATFSQKVAPWLQARKGKILSSCVVKEKNQYRLFFSDLAVLLCTFSGESVIGFSVANLDHPVHCVWSGENTGWYDKDQSGNEEIYFGSDDGWVFQMEKGTSFDGEPIEAFLRTSFYHYQTPQQRKRFFQLAIDLSSQSGSMLTISPDFSYSSDLVPQARNRDIDVLGAAGFWGASNWNEFIWNGTVAYNGLIPIGGIGENMGLFVYSSSATEAPHILYGATVDYSFRGKVR